jgi:hypothetical protein
MSDIIRLSAIETDLEDMGTDNHGYGPEYYRRKQEPTEPYYVENLNFDDAVQKEFPNRDVEVEQYLLNQAYKRGQDPNRPFQKTLQVPDWGRAGEKVRTEYWDPNSITRDMGERGHFAQEGVTTLQGQPYYTEEPTIRMFDDNPPYIHEAAHSLQKQINDPRRNIKIPSKYEYGGVENNRGAWNARPQEIQAEASAVKRDYIHNPALQKVLGEKEKQELSDTFQQETQYKKDGSKNPYYGYTVEDHMRDNGTYLPDNVQRLDRNHPAVREGMPIPEEHIDGMFKHWMTTDPRWGEFYRDKPEDFPVELFKEALRLGKNDQKPAGMFTGRGPQNA